MGKTVVIACILAFLVCQIMTVEGTTAAEEGTAPTAAISEIDDFERNELNDLLESTQIIDQDDIDSDPNDEEEVAAKQTLRDRAKTRVENFKTSLNNLRTDEDAAERVSEAVGVIGTGITTMVTAIKEKDVKAIILGAIDIVASVAAMLGPAGAVVSSLLGLVSGIWALFENSPPPESEEAMIKRVVETAIEDAQVEQQEFDIAGVKQLYQALSDSIGEFRKGSAISTNEATEFYNHAYRGVVEFGKLKENVKKYCGNANKENHGSTATEKAKVKKMVERCLSFANLFCELSISRQLLITNMASLLNENTQLLPTAENLLFLVRKEEEGNLQFLNFIVNPMKNKPYRRVAAEYWSRRQKYPVLAAYLEKLNKLLTYKPKETPLESVMVCTDTLLEGACAEFYAGTFEETRYLRGWGGKVKSVYIPSNWSITAKISTGNQGPFFGPRVISTLPDGKSWTGFKVEKDVDTSKKEASKSVLLCTEDNIATTGYCHFIEKPTASQTTWQSLASMDGVVMTSKVKSMYVPSGVKVSGKDSTKTYGPFIGPDTYGVVCGKSKWTHYKIELSTVSANNRVQICSAAGLSGQCERFNAGTTSGSDSCAWGAATIRMNSMKLPANSKVTLLGPGHVKMGPFVGPASFPYIDGYGLSAFKVRQVQIEYTTPSVVAAGKRHTGKNSTATPAENLKQTFTNKNCQGDAWNIKLDNSTHVKKVRMFKGDKSSLKGTEVRVGDTLCGKVHKSNVKDHVTLLCPENAQGNTVTISNKENNGNSPCEVKVIGRSF